MEVLASRVLLRPTDLERSRAFYRDTLKLPIFREFATPGGTGTVFFIGGGYLEVSGHADAPPAEGIELWLQVRDIETARRDVDRRPRRVEDLRRRGARRPPDAPPGLTPSRAVRPGVRAPAGEAPSRRR
jgi:catechol 2,3-dioxygenase-like lactoylglutathione lyase family enzyme